MTSVTLPMFPLELVCYPGESLALHIFEDRYQQLIEDCEQQGVSFGVPTFLDNKMEYGTEVRLERVVKRYPTGACDIICRGVQVFQLEAFYPVLEEKLYAGGKVQYQKPIDDATQKEKALFFELLTAFYTLLDVPTPRHTTPDKNSYAYAHKVGLTLEQEYEILKIASESQRYQFLILHLSRVIPTIKAVNRTKRMIRLNGHFKNFNPLDFKDFKL
ncbi:MAG: LON peptidase substrate-binding domain-containing protein [Dokdonia sp.]